MLGTPDNIVVSCAKMAEQIEMLFGLSTWVGPRKLGLGEGTDWRHLLNSIAPHMCGGTVAFCQITLTTCYYWYNQDYYIITTVSTIHDSMAD